MPKQNLVETLGEFQILKTLQELIKFITHAFDQGEPYNPSQLEGIFRLSIDHQLLEDALSSLALNPQSLRNFLDENIQTTPHLPTTLLKRLARELQNAKAPLINEEISISIRNEDYDAIQQLDPCRLAVMSTLLHCLRKLCTAETVTKMGSDNLAIIFSACLFHDDFDSVQLQNLYKAYEHSFNKILNNEALLPERIPFNFDDLSQHNNLDEISHYLHDISIDDIVSQQEMTQVSRMFEIIESNSHDAQYKKYYAVLLSLFLGSLSTNYPELKHSRAFVEKLQDIQRTLCDLYQCDHQTLKENMICEYGKSMTSEINDAPQNMYFNDNQTVLSRFSVSNGFIYDAEHHLATTSAPENLKTFYAISSEGQLYIGDAYTFEDDHLDFERSVFLHNDGWICSGTIKIQDGIPTEITNPSAKIINLILLLELFKLHGFNLSQTKIIQFRASDTAIETSASMLLNAAHTIRNTGFINFEDELHLDYRKILLQLKSYIQQHKLESGTLSIYNLNPFGSTPIPNQMMQKITEALTYSEPSSVYRETLECILSMGEDRAKNGNILRFTVTQTFYELFLNHDLLSVLSQDAYQDLYLNDTKLSF